MRKSLEKEFTSIHIFNLRGNTRTSGEVARREGGQIFGSGSRTPISITILVKNPERQIEKADIYYHDIGDYLKREDKLGTIAEFKTIANERMSWQKLVPNEHGDWINLRNGVFDTFVPLEPQKKYASNNRSFFTVNSNGLKTQRDAWCYNSSEIALVSNIQSSLQFYKDEVKRLSNYAPSDRRALINYDATKISWTESVLNSVAKGRPIAPNKNHIRKSVYRPFVKQFTYYDKDLNERTYQLPAIYPIDVKQVDNRVIAVTGAGSAKEFSTLMSNGIVGLDTVDKTQVFPLYYYEDRSSKQQGLFASAGEYKQYDGVSDYIFNQARDRYVDNRIEKEDIFYYVYGLLHSPDYRREFANDLKKMLPRLPLVDKLEDFWGFSEAGRKLAKLHVGYEEVDPYEGVKVSGTQHANYHVEKLKFGKKKEEVDGKEKSVTDKSIIHYNTQITIENIPEKAYEYVVNGKSAIEWILDRYQIKTDKASGIVNDPNDWAKEVNNPRYILDLLLSVINVSVQTVDIVNGLPKLTFENNDEKSTD